MSPFDIPQIGQFKAGLDTVGVGEQLGEEPAPRMPGATAKCGAEPAKGGQPEPQRVRDQSDHVSVASRRREIQNRVLHGQPRR